MEFVNVDISGARFGETLPVLAPPLPTYNLLLMRRVISAQRRNFTKTY